MAYYGSMSAMQPNAANAKKTSDLALKVIALNAQIEREYGEMVAHAAQFGVTRADGETDLAFMTRTARELMRKHHLLMADEAEKKVALIAEGKAQPARTGLSGLLAKASDRLASL